MNDRFNKDFIDIFGDLTKQAVLDPLHFTRNCIAPRGTMAIGQTKKTYPGHVGAQTPVTSGGISRLRHNGQP